MKKRETIFRKIAVPTLFIILITYGVSLLPVKTEYPKLIKHEAEDFDIYDLQFEGRDKEASSDNAPKELDQDIVIVELADTRPEIAAQINLVAKYSPKVMAIDALFRNTTPDSLGDLTLNMTENNLPNAVWASKLEEDVNGKFQLVNSYFDDADMKQKEAYGNFIGPELAAVRKFSPFVALDGQEHYSFSSRILERYNKPKFDRLRKRGKQQETIYYSANLASFRSFSLDELHYYDSTEQLADQVRGRIVLFGFFKKKPPHVLQDLHFTPLNEHIAGKSIPDMYGVVIHANIIRMLLAEKYITEVPGIFSYIIAAALIAALLLLEAIVERKYKRQPGFWFHVGEMILLVLLVYLFLVIFSETRVKFALFPIVFSFVAKELHKPIMEKCIQFINWLRKFKLKKIKT